MPRTKQLRLLSQWLVHVPRTLPGHLPHKPPELPSLHCHRWRLLHALPQLIRPSTPDERAWAPSRSLGLWWAAALTAGSLMVTTSPVTAAEAQGSTANPASIPVSETAVHPLDYDPVTNEHTAKMTMARTAALEYYQAGKYPQAEAKFKEAVEEAKLGFEAKDPHIASTLNNLAEFYRNTRQYSKAEQLYKEALSLLEAAFGERHWLYVSAMHNLALSYQASGQLDAARQAMEKVMKLRLTMFGARHFLYADSMYGMGHILLKQAHHQQEQSDTGSSSSTDSTKGRKWWPLSGGKSGSAGSAAALERQALKHMDDAIKILEDAESVQTEAVLHWLSTLEELYAQRGRYNDALQCARKSMHHFSNDKGEVHANASELSDRLITLLLKTGRPEEARDVAVACASARQQLFGKELAVAQAWLRLAVLEDQLKQGDKAAASQHARNAAVMSGELFEEYNKASVGNWLGQQGQDNGIKRARAAHVQASALKFLADHTPTGSAAKSPAGSAADAAVSALEAAVAVLEAALPGAARQLQSMSAKGAAAEQLDEMAGLYVELQLQLLECLEQLAVRLEAVKGVPGRLAAVKARQDELSRTLLGN